MYKFTASAQLHASIDQKKNMGCHDDVRGGFTLGCARTPAGITTITSTSPSIRGLCRVSVALEYPTRPAATVA